MLTTSVVFWISIFLLPRHKETIDEDCCIEPQQCKNPDCSCCTEERANICKTQGRTPCGGDCKPGYHGGFCYNKCPDHCLTCKDGSEPYTRDCLTCDPGYHVAHRRCVPDACPDTCLSCTNSTHCSVCAPGFYNEQSTPTLDYHSNCQHTCPEHCTSCTSQTMCLSCKNGYYGDQCSDVCSTGCNLGECFKGGSCFCKDGYSGTNCETFTGDRKCSPNCLEDACDKVTGECSYGCRSNFKKPYCKECLPYFYGQTCTLCESGKYGINCSDDCPKKCLKCNQDTGHCVVCEGNLQGNFCEICKPGYYGENCSYECPIHCAGQICIRLNGACSNGCVSVFSGDWCSNCIDGRYGITCQKECATNCKVCNKENGTCYVCTGNFWGDQCQKCRPGFYGHTCEKECSFGCINKTCDFTNGTCMCIFDFYGPYCEKQCSAHCASNATYKKCESENGKCLFGCFLGYHGETCDKECSKTCINSYCNQTTGNCTLGCEDGHKGPACDLNGNAPPQRSSSINVIISGVSGTMAVLILAALVVGLMIFIKRKRDIEGKHPYYNQPMGSWGFRIFKSIGQTSEIDPKSKLQNRKKKISEKLSYMDKQYKKVLSKMDKKRKKMENDLEIIEKQLGETMHMSSIGEENKTYEQLGHTGEDESNYSSLNTL